MIHTQLETAMARLAALPVWLDMTAENACWASCEAFFQSSLLWAFNAQRSKYLADREKELVGENNAKFKPDLLAFPAERRSDWRASRDRQTRLRLGEGFAWTKIAWARGNAWGSAIVPSKAKQICTDIESFRSVERFAELAGLIPPPKQFLEIALSTSIFPHADRSIAACEECETELIDLVQKELVARDQPPCVALSRVRLLSAHPVPSNTGEFVSLRAIVLHVA